MSNAFFVCFSSSSWTAIRISLNKCSFVCEREYVKPMTWKQSDPFFFIILYIFLFHEPESHSMKKKIPFQTDLPGKPIKKRTNIKYRFFFVLNSLFFVYLYLCIFVLFEHLVVSPFFYLNFLSIDLTNYICFVIRGLVLSNEVGLDLLHLDGHFTWVYYNHTYCTDWTDRYKNVKHKQKHFKWDVGTIILFGVLKTCLFFRWIYTRSRLIHFSVYTICVCDCACLSLELNHRQNNSIIVLLSNALLCDMCKNACVCLLDQFDFSR